MKSTLDASSLNPSQTASSLERTVSTNTVWKAASSVSRTLTQGRWFSWVISAWVVAIMVFVVCLGLGTRAIPYSKIIEVIIGTMASFSIDQGLNDPTSVILLHVRMPRVVLAFLVGGSLAMVGVALQALLRNPLADPFVIGISSGAALGAAIALLFGIGISVGSISALPVCAFAGALFSLMIMYRISSAQFGFSRLYPLVSRSGPQCHFFPPLSCSLRVLLNRIECLACMPGSWVR